jgi:ABC-2 type transport system permease protein
VTELHGTWPLVRLIVARDKLRLLAWIAGIVVLVVTTAASTKALYPTQEDLDAIAAAARDNPVALAFNGPDLALDTMGGQIAFQVGAFGLLVVGLMSLLLLGRATRGEEDSGRLEMVRAMPVGRHAPLAAALIVVIGADVVLGALTAASLLAQDLPAQGSIVFGAAFTALGLTFVGITAVTAQVSDNPRVAAGIAGAVLGASYVLRAVGDMGDGTVSWLSPLGWAQQARPYAGERWWPLLLCAVIGVGLVWVAAVLAEHRDFGSGMVAPKPGPARAAPSLGSPLGLALRLHRGAIGWWALSVLTLGVVYGSLTENIDDLIGDNPSMEDVIASIGTAGLTDSYLATSLLVISLLAAGPALQVMARLRSEEAGLRAEAMLATRVTRAGWVASHLVAALAGSALTLVVGGAGLGTAYAVAGGGARQVPRLTGAALAYVPAVWLLVGLALALFGLVPRWTAGAWVALTVCLVIAMFGPLLDLPSWVLDLSPFEHTPGVPAEAVRVLPLAVLVAVAAALTAIGFAAFRTRDLVTS